MILGLVPVAVLASAAVPVAAPVAVVVIAVAPASAAAPVAVTIPAAAPALLTPAAFVTGAILALPALGLGVRNPVADVVVVLGDRR